MTDRGEQEGLSLPRADDIARFAHDWLRAEILNGNLRPGAVLSQVQIASRLGISRTPLREALRQLTAEGLLEGDFNRRTRVSALDLTDFDQIYAMRSVLEPLALGVTVDRLTDQDCSSLVAAVDAMDTAVIDEDRDAFRLAHRAFHLGLMTYSGDRIGRSLAELWDHSERYRLRYLHTDVPSDPTFSERLDRSQAEHRAILAAALERDTATCVELLAKHRRRTLDAVFLEMAPPRRQLADLVVVEDAQ